MLVTFSLFLVVCCSALLGKSQTIESFVPNKVPLGIRSPYFNAWVQGSGSDTNWPTFWNEKVSIFPTSLLSMVLNFTIRS